tara:strand:+ start:9092 stop:9640 length:549 start_codon:yes stop_codon:yes gene_type:complete
MVTYTNKIYSDTQIVKAWNTSNKDDEYLMVTRGQKNVSKYSITNIKYKVAMDENKIVGYYSWVDHGNWIHIGGVRVREGYQGQGIASNMISKLTQIINKKPTLVVINTKNMKIQIWVNTWINRGWVQAPNNEDIEGIPDEVLDYTRDRSKNNWLVYQPNVMNKAWNIIKNISEEEAIIFMEE